MTKPVPEHIKRNFIYRKIWNDIYREEENAVLLWIGNVGKGKIWIKKHKTNEL